MPDFVYLIHPLRDGFFEQTTPEEDAIMEEHFRYLQSAADQHKVLLAGPCLDQTFGLVILTAENDQAARQFMLADPAIRENVMMAELHPLQISIRAQ